MKHQLQSGESDDVIFKKALKVYKKENNKPFTFVEFCLVKDNEKWKRKKHTTNMFVMVPYSKKRPNLSTLHQVPVLESTLTMMISFKLHHFPAH